LTIIELLPKLKGDLLEQCIEVNISKVFQDLTM